MKLSRLPQVIVACFLILASCDEVLEACQRCPDIGSGAMSVAGDPRLDRSLEAMVRLGRQHRAASGRLSSALTQALEAYGLDFEGGPPTTGMAEKLWQAVETDLEREDLSVALAREPSVCAAQTPLLAEVMLACQVHLGCYVSDECRIQRIAQPKMLCAGLCRGPCETTCIGHCLSTFLKGETSCGDSCLGACVSPSASNCAGLCFGQCSGPCSAWSQDGGCEGHCFGQCTGACVMDRLQPCVDSVCHGRCAMLSTGYCAGLGTCHGQCQADGCHGGCLGLVEPSACDERYCDGPEDALGLSQCHAAVRDLSAATIECRGGRAIISARFEGVFPPDGYAVLHRLHVLQNSLQIAIEVEDWARLVGLGEDPAGEIEPEWLAVSSPKVEASVANVDLFAAAVPNELSAAPAWALKLRAFALSQQGVATAFNVVAGAAPCVPRAFQDAHRELSALLPTVEVEKGRLDADRKPGTVLGLIDAAAALTGPLLSR